MRRNEIVYALCVASLLLSLGLFFPDKASAGEVINLKISHFGPREWDLHRNLLEPWARKIEKLTRGRVKFTIYPKQKLGTSKEQYELVVKGVADVSLSLQGYTQERFPLTTVMTLPFLGESGEKASIVLWALYEKYLREEYKDVKVLALFCHGPGQIHTVSKKVKTLQDLKGLRIRMPNPVLGKVIKSLGATPVVTPVTDAVQMVRKGKLDGACLPWEGFYNFKFLETKNHTNLNLYTLPFFVVMNKEKYASLPADIKKIFDENSGEGMSALAGKVMDDDDKRGIRFAEGRGDFIYTLPKSEVARWKKITMPMGDEWVEKMKAKGLPGQEVLTYVVDLFIQLQE